MKSPIKKAKQRPAETVGGIGGAISAIGAALGAPPRVYGAVAIFAAFLPAIITYVVSLKRAAQ
jgi:hypothetical protein